MEAYVSRWWCSWYEVPRKRHGWGPIHGGRPRGVLGFWRSGETMMTSTPIMCALVVASTAEEVEAIVDKHWRRANGWRIEPSDRGPFWTPGDRFPLDPTPVKP